MNLTTQSREGEGVGAGTSWARAVDDLAAYSRGSQLVVLPWRGSAP
jgi:hypothetical protein